MGMRILVTGSREWDEPYSCMMMYLWSVAADLEDVTVIHGGARGADAMAALVADMEGWRTEVHAADWDKHGLAAGPIRNQEMVDAGADICLAFLKEGAANRGTLDCISRAEKAGIPVEKHWCAGEGGVREPSGSGPDHPIPNEPGVPGPGGEYRAIENHPDDSGRIKALVGS